MVLFEQVWIKSAALVDSFIEYEVSLGTANRSWVVSRRYREFDALNVHLAALLKQLPVQLFLNPFPPKTFMSLNKTNSDITSLRKAILEVYVKDILINKTHIILSDRVCRDFFELDQNLKLSKHSLKVLTAFETDSQTLKESILRTDLLLRNNNNPNDELNRLIRECEEIVQLHLSILKYCQVTGNYDFLVQKKVIDRLDMVYTWHERIKGYKQLTALSTTTNPHSKQVGVGRTIVATQSRSIEPTLIQPSSSYGGENRRVWGASNSSSLDDKQNRIASQLELTGKSTDSVLRLQQEKIQDQDKGLARLHHLVLKQKHIAKEIGTELDAQNEMLDRLGNKVDTTHAQMAITCKSMNRLV